MIKIIGIIFTAAALTLNGVYDFTVSKIEGSNQALSAYNGKRLLIITLPVQQSAAADSLLYSLDTIATAHAATHKVIAVPAFEDGFTASQRSSLLSWYRSKLGTHVLITDGIYTHKTSAQQHDLFKWLTDKDRNGIFDVGPEAAGYKYFTMADGKLNAVLSPAIPVWGATVNRALTIEAATE